jgi:hypothetical protein
MRGRSTVADSLSHHSVDEEPPQGSVYVELSVTKRIALSRISQHWTKDEAARFMDGDKEMRDQLILSAQTLALREPDSFDVEVAQVWVGGKEEILRV